MSNSYLNSDLRDFLFRNNPIPMFLYDDDSLRILGANNAAHKAYGYTQKEFRRLTVRDLRPHRDQPALNTVLLLNDDVPSQSLWTHTTKSGRLFAVEVRVMPFIRGRRKLCLMSVVDASSWSDARLKLLRSEQIHRSLVDECPFGIYRLNLTTGHFEQANPALLRAIGYTMEELCSTNIANLYVDSSDRDRYLSLLRSTGRVLEFETRFRRKDGSAVRVSLAGYLFTDPHGSQQYIQGYVQDVTRNREIEDKLSHSHRMEAVGRLAGGVAHDFNNITQSISLSCELALQGLVNPAIESKLLDIMQQASRAAEITRQLLAFSRRQVLQPRVVNINEVIRKSLPILNRAVGVNVTLDLQLDETIDHVLIDPDQLSLVLMHLADNARIAMPHGGKLQILTASHIISPGLTAATDEPCVMLAVSDTGVGMSEATLQRIFEPFFSTKETTVTTGLGLSTVHGIISQSKGRIECESSVGDGTTFRIYLPFAVGRQFQTAVCAANDCDGRCILLAEDDPIVNKHLAHALVLAGFAVDAVADGEEALCASNRKKYDVVVTDIMMPKLGGIELTRRLRRQIPEIPVVLISGYTEEISVLQHLPSDRIAYLQKPFASPKLISTIRSLLSSVEQEVVHGA